MQLDIEDKYSNIPLKTLTSFAHLWTKLNQDLEWIIKMDDDLELRLDAIWSQLKESKCETDLHCPAVMKNMPNALPKDLCSWPRMPDFCNGYVYAVKPKIAQQLVAVSRQTPKLPLDDIFITGVLRGRLKKVGIKLLNRFEYGAWWMEWFLECPFLGVFHHFLVQNLAFEKDQWPWGTLYKVACNGLKRYLDDHQCG